MADYGRGYAFVVMDLTGDMRDQEAWQAAWDAMQQIVGHMIPENRPQAYLTKSPEHVAMLDQISREIEIQPHHVDPHPKAIGESGA